MRVNKNNDQIQQHLKLNYFPNDQSKHIDFVIHYNDESLDLPLGKKSQRNKRLIKLKQRRNKFLIQLITEEEFEIFKIIKRLNDKQTSNYLLLHCPLSRLMLEAERMHKEMPLKDVNYLGL